MKIMPELCMMLKQKYNTEDKTKAFCIQCFSKERENG